LPVIFSCEFVFLGAEAMKIIVRNVTPRSVKDIYRLFIGMCSSYVQPIKQGTMHMRNFLKYSLHYTTSHFKRLISELLQSTYSRHSEETYATQPDLLRNIDVNSSLHKCPPQVYTLSPLNPCGAEEEWERSGGTNRVGNEEILHRVK
jgi:hypothetical protein